MHGKKDTRTPKVSTCPNGQAGRQTEKYLVEIPITLFNIVFYGDSR
jgi:hypothetical protein